MRQEPPLWRGDRNIRVQRIFRGVFVKPRSIRNTLIIISATERTPRFKNQRTAVFATISLLRESLSLGAPLER